jgi:hypothetical protein
MDDVQKPEQSGLFRYMCFAVGGFLSNSVIFVDAVAILCSMLPPSCTCLEVNQDSNPTGTNCEIGVITLRWLVCIKILHGVCLSL